MSRVDVKKRFVTEQGLRNLQIDTQPLEREARSASETDANRKMYAKVLQVIKEQIQPRLDRAFLYSEHSEPLIVATNFSQAMFEFFDRCRGDRHLRFMYVADEETLCFMSDPHQAHEIIHREIGDHIMDKLQAALDDAPFAGREAEEAIAKSSDGNFRGVKLLKYIVREMGSTLVKFQAIEMGIISKEPDWGIKRRGNPVAGHRMPLMVLEVAVFNESRSLTAEETQWWSQGGTDLALGMKVNRSSSYAFNPRISLFSAVTQRTETGKTVQKRSYEMGRGSHVAADLAQLDADFGEVLPNYRDLVQGIDVQGSEQSKQAPEAVPGFEEMPKGHREISLPVGPGLQHAWLMSPCGRRVPAEPAFTNYLKAIEITLDASKLRDICIHACFEVETTLQNDMDWFVDIQDDAGVALLEAEATHHMTYDLQREALADTGLSLSDTHRLWQDAAVDFDRRVRDHAKDMVS